MASLLGYGIFNTLLSRNPSSYVVPWVLLAPVVAMASAWLLLDQRPTSAELVGGVVLILGVLVAMRITPRLGRGRPPERGAEDGRDVGEDLHVVVVGERE